MIDKSSWDRGPWDDEPDYLEWTDDATGYPCVIKRADVTGSLLGYVGVPKKHAFFGKQYSAKVDMRLLGMKIQESNPMGTFMSLMELADDKDAKAELSYAVQVHGGLTFSGSWGGADDVWWFGFDCSHFDDKTPAMDATMRKVGCGTEWRDKNVYRDLAFVKSEVTGLARQLKDMA